MYCSFYEIQEKPFSITPDPKFLYLGTTHKEAFAHLLYGIRERGGFIVITGEIGTGKTTLCRALLTHLDQHTIVAFIFNPTLSSLELLKSINEDFGLSSQGNTKKELIDELNRFLLEKRKEGKNTVLIIDEVQNLDMEVLEQIRLLSNLETDTEKLLQIILVGQPEFRQILAQPSLLQLDQRVTVRYHLHTLSEKETAAYIQHRLLVVDAEDKIHFSKDTYKKIHRYTKGVPRLINVLCDRALLAGYSLRNRNINCAMVDKAYKEVSDSSATKKFPVFRRFLGYGAVTASVLVIGFLLWNLGMHFLRAETSWDWAADLKQESYLPADKEILPATPRVAAAPSGLPASATLLEKEKHNETLPDDISTDHSRTKKEIITEDNSVSLISLERIAEKEIDEQKKFRSIFLNSFNERTLFETREQAFSAIVKKWYPQVEKNDSLRVHKNSSDLYAAADNMGFHCYYLVGDINRIKILNLPVILELKLGSDALSKRYAAVLAVEGSYARISPALFNGSSLVPINMLEAYWSGSAYLLWKDVLGKGMILREGWQGEVVSNLQAMLLELDYYYKKPTGIYDADTTEAVRAFQQDHSLAIDGIIGSETKIVLLQVLKRFNMPQLAKTVVNEEFPE